MPTRRPDHRHLRFDDLEMLLGEIDRIVAAERAGRLRRSGNWTTGQTFGHLAAWIEYGYEGYPFRTPWYIRVVIRMMMLRYLTKGMPAGLRIPATPGGTYGTEVMSTEEGERRLKAALERLRREPARFDSPSIGRLSEHQRQQLNLRHAELHLGFLHPE